MPFVLRNQDGQAVVEAAILLPGMVVLFLMILQLALLQEARLLADYAAFSAARTGIVHNADNGKDNKGTDGAMHDAAVFALLPSYGRTDSFTTLAETALRFKVEETALTALGLAPVRVFVRSPVAKDFQTYGGHLNGQELDFDDVRPGATDATLLSLQVRYLFELRVPFANKMIQTIWLAARAGVLSNWRGFDWTTPRFVTSSGLAADPVSRAAAAALTVADGTPEGIRVASLLAAGATGRFFLPVEAYATQRMQSNPYLKWAHP
jgi:hypothetical protein